MLNLFNGVTRMQINAQESSLSANYLSNEELDQYKTLFPYELVDFDREIKYFVFHLNPNNYKKVDWEWLIGKLEKILKVWSFRWISRARRLILVKSMLEPSLFIGCHWHGSLKEYWKRFKGFVSSFFG